MRVCLLLTSILWLPVVSRAAELEWIRVSDDGKSFVQEPSGKTFVPWGVNYDHDRNGRLIEDYWNDEWSTIEEDFREIRELGANVVRIHLQFARFMKSPTEANSQALDQLERLVHLADQTGLYLDLTGLACYHKQDVPDWYDAMDEQARWQAQTEFWRAVSRRCADHPAVFFYDLMNEPIVPGKRGGKEGWLTGLLGGKYFGQLITLTPGDRPGHEIAKAWIDTLVKSIRQEDSRHLITVGMLPYARGPFDPLKTAENLDFIAVHVYPEREKPELPLKIVQDFQIGKPLIVEEIYPLQAGQEAVVDFMREAKPYVTGWISFYWGETPAELTMRNDFGSQIQAAWLKKFQELGEEIRAQP